MSKNPYLDYTTMDALIRGGKPYDVITEKCHCSRSTVVKRARDIGCQRKKTGRPRPVSKPMEKCFDYLAALRAGFPQTKKPLEDLSSYMQGNGESGVRVHSKGHGGAL